AAGALSLSWLLGVSRRIGELVALTSIGAYVLAVGPQPSVIRAGIAGGLASLACVSARMVDRWHFLLPGAVALLGGNADPVFDAGLAQRLARRLPRDLRAHRRRSAGRTDPLHARAAGARRGRTPGCRLCLAAVATELKPVYLIVGGDRPKIQRAIRRLRDRIG